MSRFPEGFTIENLNEAWSEWRRNYDNTQRFGQYLYNTRVVDGQPWPELFHERNEYHAMTIAGNDILGYNGAYWNEEDE